MIREVEKLPEKCRGNNRRKTPMSVFCEKTIREFVESGMRVAVVTGFPGGDPSNSREANSKVSSMGPKLKAMGVDGVSVFIRNHSIYLVKDGDA